MAKNVNEALEWTPADDEEEVGGDLNIWNPAVDGKEGDELVGEVVEINEGMYGIEAKIREFGLEEDDKVIWTTPAHKVLQSALAKLAVGDVVRITYTGVYKTKSNMIAKSYRVAKRK